MDDLMEYLRGLLRQGPGRIGPDPVGEGKHGVDVMMGAESPEPTRRQKIDSRLSRAQSDYDLVQGAISGKRRKIENPDGTVTWEQEQPKGLDELNAERAEVGKLPLTIQGTEDALKYAKGQEALQRRREAERMASESQTMKDVVQQQQAGQPPQQQNQNLNRPDQNDQAGMFPGLAPTQLTNPETGQPVQAFARLGQDIGDNAAGQNMAFPDPEPPPEGDFFDRRGSGKRGSFWDRSSSMRQQAGQPLGSNLPGGQNRWWTAMGPGQRNSIMQPKATPGQTPGNMPMGGRATMHPQVQQWMSTGGKRGVPPVALRQTYDRMQKQYQADPQKFKNEWQKYVEDNLPQQFHWMVQ